MPKPSVAPEAGAKKRHRGLLQRFALVLQAKIDKASDVGSILGA